MNRIIKVSVFFRIFFQILFVTIPLLVAYSWIKAPNPIIMASGFVQLNAIPKNYEHAILHTLTMSEKIQGFLLSCLPLIIHLYIIYSLIKLFRLFEQREIFSLNNVRYIRNIGYALLVGQLINPIYQGLMGIILTIHNPHGHRFASVTLDQTNIGILLTALLVILISWIVAEGYKLRIEQELII